MSSSWPSQTSVDISVRLTGSRCQLWPVFTSDEPQTTVPIGCMRALPARTSFAAAMSAGSVNRTFMVPLVPIVNVATIDVAVAVVGVCAAIAVVVPAATVPMRAAATSAIFFNIDPHVGARRPAVVTARSYAKWGTPGIGGPGDRIGVADTNRGGRERQKITA